MISLFSSSGITGEWSFAVIFSPIGLDFLGLACGSFYLLRIDEKHTTITLQNSYYLKGLSRILI
jgi:hypothetical protein